MATWGVFLWLFVWGFFWDVATHYSVKAWTAIDVSEGLNLCLILSAKGMSAMFSVTWCGMLSLCHMWCRNDATGDIMNSCQSSAKWDTAQCTAVIYTKSYLVPVSLLHCVRYVASCAVFPLAAGLEKWQVAATAGVNHEFTKLWSCLSCTFLPTLS